MKPVGSGVQKPGYTISQAFGNQGLDIDSGFRKPEMATLNCLPTALPRMMVLGQESAGTEGMREIHASMREIHAFSPAWLAVGTCFGPKQAKIAP